jgi:hypothetical protein
MGTKRGDSLIKIFSAGFAALLLVLTVPGCEKSRPTAQEKVLVKVGKRTITLGEFEEALRRLLPEGVEDVKKDELKELKKNLLNQLIEEELVIEEALRRGICDSFKIRR